MSDARTAPGRSGADLPPWLAAMVAGLSPLGIVELERVLRHELFPPETAAERRVAQLGALAALLAASDERINRPVRPAPGVLQGQGAAQRRAGWAERGWRMERVTVIPRDVYGLRRPADAPSSRVLVALYGSWEQACRAASGLLPDGRWLGPGQPWPSAVRGRPRVRGYTRREITGNSIRECALALLRQPSCNLYMIGHAPAGALSGRAPASTRDYPLMT